MTELSQLDASVVASRISGRFTTQIPAVPRLSLDIKPANSDDAPRESPHEFITDRYSTDSDPLEFCGQSTSDIMVVFVGNFCIWWR